MSAKKYSIGIDLGTTNSVISYRELEQENAQLALLDIPQLVDGATVERRKSLASFLYIAADHELGSATFSLPWDDAESPHVVGEIARRRSAETPMRTIAAAKSWLCHHGIDRHGAVLPWNAPNDIPKISPVEVSRRYLEHMVSAWNHEFPNDPLCDQSVVLTVPASFDASARDLTRQAAILAGLPEDVVLLEEPQSALYSWLAHSGDVWRKQLKVGDTILVCDVGGGTSDFSLITVVDRGGDLTLERVAVGNHLLVGGDNMDLALAHLAKSYFAEKDIELDAWQAVSLWHACRAAKETLLSENPPESFPVTILGRGSKLIGGTVSVDLPCSDVAAILMAGFFPPCPLDAKPQKRFSSGFKEIGLPFEADARITHHLAQFLSSQKTAAGEPIIPTHVLFNGGVFRAEPFRLRMLEVLNQWFQDQHEIKPLEGKHELDFAVAYGAAYYGAVKQGEGIRIRGGTARSYYVGIESAGLAVPGMERPLRALCVVPFGMEEGTETDVPGQEIGLVVGEPVQFRFFGSSVRKEDKPGEIMPSATAPDIQETDPINTTLTAAEETSQGYVPVTFHAKITELGMLELWCKSALSEKQWKLEFNVREETGA